MPLPYQYRDYPLALLMGVAIIVGGFSEYFGAPRQPVEITLAEACCQDGECPVIDSLAKLPSVDGVRHAPAGDRTVVSLHTFQSESALEIWDAVASTQNRPVKLVIGSRVMESRPIE